jgi:hypothetical protein
MKNKEKNPSKSDSAETSEGLVNINQSAPLPIISLTADSSLKEISPSHLSVDSPQPAGRKFSIVSSAMRSGTSIGFKRASFSAEPPSVKLTSEDASTNDKVIDIHEDDDNDEDEPLTAVENKGFPYKAGSQGSYELHQKADLRSLSSALTGQSLASSGREISESTTMKLYDMKYCFLSFIINLLLLILQLKMKNGMVVPISHSLVSVVGTVILELLFLLANIIALIALDCGASVYFGKLLSSKHGYSLAVCGFYQSGPISKWSFCSDLSLNSKCRKNLTRVSIVWFVIESLKILTPLAAIGLEKTDARGDQGTVNCLLYGQRNVPVDRHFPNVNARMIYYLLIFREWIR